MCGDLRALLGPDTHQPLRRQVLGDPHQVRARDERDADEYGQSCLEDAAEVAAGAADDDEAGDARDDQGDPGRGPGQRPEALAVAHLDPACLAGVVGLPPDQGDAERDDEQRPHRAVRGPEVEVVDEDAGADGQRDQGHDLALVRALARQPGTSVARLLRLGDPADAERHEEPEDGVEQQPDAVEGGEDDEQHPYPQHRQPEVVEPARGPLRRQCGPRSCGRACAPRRRRARARRGRRLRTRPRTRSRGHRRTRRASRRPRAPPDLRDRRAIRSPRRAGCSLTYPRSSHSAR